MFVTAAVAAPTASATQLPRLEQYPSTPEVLNQVKPPTTPTNSSESTGANSGVQTSQTPSATPKANPTPVTPKPTAVTPKPTAVTPKPTAVTPKPTAVTPKPTTVTPPASPSSPSIVTSVQQALPFTGFDLSVIVVAGGLLVALGLLVRRRARDA
jgi:hypothetical protein